MLIGPKSKVLNFVGLNPTGDFGPLTGYTSKRRRPVWFLKAPPTTPATGWQLRQRNKFRRVAELWSELSSAQRLAWQNAASRAHLNVTAYNLFVWYHLVKDRNALATIEHQSGIDLPL